MSLNDQDILDYIAGHPGAGREDIRLHVVPEVSGPTIWRALKRLVDEGRLFAASRNSLRLEVSTALSRTNGPPCR
jgi:hypothetical protein